LKILKKIFFEIVWKGAHEKTQEPVACKVVPKANLKIPKLKELFITEVKYLKLINNDNVVKLIEYLESATTCYIVM